MTTRYYGRKYASGNLWEEVSLREWRAMVTSAHYETKVLETSPDVPTKMSDRDKCELTDQATMNALRKAGIDVWTEQPEDDMAVMMTFAGLKRTILAASEGLAKKEEPLSFKGETFSNWWERHCMDGSNMDYASAELAWKASKIANGEAG